MGKMTIVAQRAPAPGCLADDYLALKAKLADLKLQEKKLQDAILATGEKVLEGTFGRVAVSIVEDSWAFDYRAAAEANLKPEVIAQYTKTVAGSTRFNVRARRTG